jgi:hypothetical protein
MKDKGRDVMRWWGWDSQGPKRPLVYHCFDVSAEPRMDKAVKAVCGQTMLPIAVPDTVAGIAARNSFVGDSVPQSACADCRADIGI